MVPKTRNETVLSNQDHFDIIVIQFVNTIVPLVEMYLQKLFDTKEELIDAVEVNCSFDA